MKLQCQLLEADKIFCFFSFSEKSAMQLLLLIRGKIKVITNRTERLNFTDRSKPSNTTDSRHLSLTANNITANLACNRTKNIRLTTTIHLTLMMTSARVVETLVTITDNSPFQDYPHPDDQIPLSHVTPGFQASTVIDIFLFFSIL